MFATTTCGTIGPAVAVNMAAPVLPPPLNNAFQYEDDDDDDDDDDDYDDDDDDNYSHLDDIISR